MIPASALNALMIPLVVAGVAVTGCTAAEDSAQYQPPTPVTVTDTAAVSQPDDEALLEQSWDAYTQRFIQADGRVIDREDGDRTVSEGQAYAMLRAVMIDDRDTFVRTLYWAEENLARRNPDGTLTDHLWAWKWGQNDDGSWGILDENFAVDADIDAATALILAARRWNEPDYLDLAQIKLNNIWELSTVEVPTPRGRERLLLPGPTAAFQPQEDVVYLNPSYMAPYAFRMFAQIDPDHDWMSLVDSSYAMLEASSAVSPVGLPGDWIAYNTSRQEYYPIEGPRLTSVYSFDAYRVWWRIALDAAWFGEERAIAYLDSNLSFLEDLWQEQQAIPARIDLEGNALVEYESTAQYGMLYSAFRLTNPAIANQIRTQKLLPTYSDGFWDNDTAYYTHNLSWFGLYTPEQLAASWLRP